MAHTKSYAENGWVLGLSTFAGIVLAMSGMFQLFQGLAAVLNQNYFVIGSNYAYYLDIGTWGWINLIIGGVVAIAGFYIFAGSTWARVVGIIVAILSAISNFFYIPYYPIWSLLIITLDVAVIWALSVYNRSVEVE